MLYYEFVVVRKNKKFNAHLFVYSSWYFVILFAENWLLKKRVCIFPRSLYNTRMPMLIKTVHATYNESVESVIDPCIHSSSQHRL